MFEMKAFLSVAADSECVLPIQLAKSYQSHPADSSATAECISDAHYST